MGGAKARRLNQNEGEYKRRSNRWNAIGKGRRLRKGGKEEKRKGREEEEE